ncbi:MAG TPA: DUF5666 domain-containing protein [Vicinamibacterales bacterium]
MKTRIILVVAVALALQPACALRIRRQAPYEWQLRGRITAVGPDSLEVRHKSGRRVLLRVDARTDIVTNGRPASAASLAVGARVMVDVESGEDGVYRALRIRLSG